MMRTYGRRYVDIWICVRFCRWHWPFARTSPVTFSQSWCQLGMIHTFYFNQIDTQRFTWQCLHVACNCIFSRDTGTEDIYRFWRYRVLTKGVPITRTGIFRGSMGIWLHEVLEISVVLECIGVWTFESIASSPESVWFGCHDFVLRYTIRSGA